MVKDIVNIQDRVKIVREKIAAAALKTGRKADDVALVAVTKMSTVAQILEARSAGITLFAENRVQDAQEKVPQVQGEGTSWQMIGHLQTNKVKTALSLFSLIQSVDTVRLAETISKASVEENRVTPILLEVNIAEQTQKYGFKSEDLYSAIDEIAQFPGVTVQGLMGIAPHPADEAAKRKAFKNLKGMFGVCKSLKHANVSMKILSMGMSDDYEIAIEEGSNMVRLGRAIFS